jgi:Reverse transcriptase (RNA-dependent DNA polymerase)/RNase H-like domain found in reverse transcriptase
MKMVKKFRKVFSGPEGKLGKVNSRYDMEINADPKTIKSQQPYHTSPKKRELINEAVDTLLELDVIELSNSQVASPVIVVIQKGKPSFCVDLREVNSKMAADRYTLPKQDSIFRALVKAIYFSIIDANCGYHQFGLKKASRFLTAFVTEDGFWQFKRMPFGLKNAPSHFQRAIDTILGSYRFEFALAFIDDIVIFSKSLAEHILHVSLVLEALQKVGMTVSEAKCHSAYQNIQLLGRRVSHLGLSTQKEKVKAIMELPYPRTIGEASIIFGQFNYHRDFIKGFAEISKPITDGMSPSKNNKKKPGREPNRMSPKEYTKMHSNTPFPDTPKIREAFQNLKLALSNAPVLIHPNFEKEFVLYTDACRKGIAGALYQMGDDSKEHPVLFIS